MSQASLQNELLALVSNTLPPTNGTPNSEVQKILADQSAAFDKAVADAANQNAGKILDAAKKGTNWTIGVTICVSTDGSAGNFGFYYKRGNSGIDISTSMSNVNIGVLTPNNTVIPLYGVDLTQGENPSIISPATSDKLVTQAVSFQPTERAVASTLDTVDPDTSGSVTSTSVGFNEVPGFIGPGPWKLDDFYLDNGVQLIWLINRALPELTDDEKQSLLNALESKTITSKFINVLADKGNAAYEKQQIEKETGIRLS